MLPAVWMRLDALPLNANGKVDRAALPPPVIDVPDHYVAPRTATEQALAEIWADVLNRTRIGVDDDIFMLGADSIQIFQITARANRKGLPLLAKTLMKQRTIAHLARSLDAGEATPSVPHARPPVRTTRPPFKPAGDRHFVSHS
jgi:aryl carrier-like protein